MYETLKQYRQFNVSYFIRFDSEYTYTDLVEELLVSLYIESFVSPQLIK